MWLCTQCPKKHVRYVNGYSDGAVDPTFPFIRFVRRNDFNLKELDKKYVNKSSFGASNIAL